MVKSVLVVDADDESRKLLSHLLQIFGYEEVKEAKDGLDALWQISQKSPDMVVVDIQTPKLDSFLISEILNNVPRYRGIPVALMGATLDVATMEKGMQSGIYAFLEKPLTPEGVKRVLAGVQTPSTATLEMSASAQVIVPAIEAAAKGVLTLIFGQQAKILKIEEFSSDKKKETWGVAGIIRAKGVPTIEIALGYSVDMAKSLATWLGKKDVSLPTLGQAQGELLTSILKRSLTRIEGTYPVRPEPAQVNFNAPLAISSAASEAYIIHFRVVMQRAILQKQLTLFLVVSLVTRVS